MANIKDVAATAGVSTATVSRVLSEYPHVRPEVRERVLAAIAQLDYRPNLVARNLRSSQSKTLGLIVSDIRNPFFTAISRAVEDTAYEYGYSILLCNTDENPEKELLYLQLMHDEQVAGVIFSPTRHTIANFASLNIDYPTVFIDRAPRSVEADAVLLDNVTAAYLLTKHLIDQGYRRIAAMFGETSTTGQERMRGYQEALNEHNLALSTEYVRMIPPRIETGLATTLDLLTLIPEPDAIFTSNSLLMAGAMQALRASKRSIPDDVALVGFDETSWTNLVEPCMTVMAQPTDDIGKTATELVLQRIADPHRSPRKIILQGELIVRDSSRAKQS